MKRVARSTEAKSARQLAMQVLSEVILQRKSLAILDKTHALEELSPSDRAFAQALCYGVMRDLLRLEYYVSRLLSKPLRKKDADVRVVFLIGLYQLYEMRVPPHAAIHESVELVRVLGKPWATGLVNAVLRNAQREKASLQVEDDMSLAVRYAHPEWLIAALQVDWPEHWPLILAANDAEVPMVLRVNQQRTSVEAYLALLANENIPARPAEWAPEGIVLKDRMSPNHLPGFSAGLVSVQNSSAQLAAGLLAPEPDMAVLDACAAPGGKTAHLAEYMAGKGRIVAVDISQKRLEKVKHNANRLQLSVEAVCADASGEADWWTGEPFQRILLDAPCSGTGVIRHHPDIKYLRQQGDIAALTDLQASLLARCWTMLAPGGLLLYATCSVLRVENSGQMMSFLAANPDAEELPIEAAWGESQDAGRQILPEGEADGFYYALIRKRA